MGLQSSSNYSVAMPPNAIYVASFHAGISFILIMFYTALNDTNCELTRRRVATASCGRMKLLLPVITSDFCGTSSVLAIDLELQSSRVSPVCPEWQHAGRRLPGTYLPPDVARPTHDNLNCSSPTVCVL